MKLCVHENVKHRQESRRKYENKVLVWKILCKRCPERRRTNNLSIYYVPGITFENTLSFQSSGYLWERREQCHLLKLCFILGAAAAKSLQSCPTLCDPIDSSHQAPPSLRFSRQEHWSGLPFPSPMQESEKWKWSHSVVSDSSRPHGLQPTRLLHPWDFPGKSTGVGYIPYWRLKLRNLKNIY